MQRMFLMAAKTTRLGEPRDLAAITTFLLSSRSLIAPSRSFPLGGSLSAALTNPRSIA
jgi:hypothetical protein